MSKSLVGWLWVAGQAVLLGALVLWPGSDAWPRPTGLLAVAGVLFFAGLVLIAVSAFGLGSALTPTPVPTSGGRLTTSGLYRLVRHPIYTGVLATVAGITLRSGNWVHVAIAIATYLFFDRKAAWEEQQLREAYPDYDDYAARTPKFIPGTGGKRSGAG